MPAIVLPTKTSQNPLCPNTQDGTVHEVRVFSGAGGDRLAYTCTCGLTWNQKRPDLLLPGEDPGLQLSNRAALGGTKRSSRDYQCRACGVPKKGHVCPNSKKKARMTTPPPPPETDTVVLPVSTPLMREQYEDILEFSTPPTDAQVLAFLRKYDLRPSEATDVYKNMEAHSRALPPAHEPAVGADILTSSDQIEAAIDELVETPDTQITLDGDAMAMMAERTTMLDDAVAMTATFLDDEAGEEAMITHGEATTTAEEETAGSWILDELSMGWPDVPTHVPEPEARSETPFVDEFNNIGVRVMDADLATAFGETDAESMLPDPPELVVLNHDICADCKVEDILDNDFNICSCGTTVVHPFCFKICAHCP